LLKTLTKIQHLSKVNQKAIASRLKRIARYIDLEKTDDVEKFIYSLDISNNYRNKLFLAYGYYCDANDIVYSKPKNQQVKSPAIQVPTEDRIDIITACCGWVYSTVFSLSKYGLRPQEIANLTLRDIDLEHNMITIPATKLGNQRSLRLASKTTDILRSYIIRRKIMGIDQRLFASANKIKRSWRHYRQRAYDKFKDSELLKIRLYDLRHWFATSTYMKTRDIFYVKYALGHRKLENTTIYVHIANGLMNYSDEYHSAIAKTLDEARQLIEQGFEYICEMEGVKLFRKRK
jgi:integrase